MLNRMTAVEDRLPITFVYGSRSWIDHSVAYVVRDNRKGKTDIRVWTISNPSVNKCRLVFSRMAFLDRRENPIEIWTGWRVLVDVCSHANLTRSCSLTPKLENLTCENQFLTSITWYLIVMGWATALFRCDSSENALTSLLRFNSAGKEEDAHRLENEHASHWSTGAKRVSIKSAQMQICLSIWFFLSGFSGQCYGMHVLSASKLCRVFVCIRMGAESWLDHSKTCKKNTEKLTAVSSSCPC